VYNSEVSWLSKGKVLQNFPSLLDETEVFLIEKAQPLSHFEDAKEQVATEMQSCKLIPQQCIGLPNEIIVISFIAFK
jgi:hypothetical protein